MTDPILGSFDPLPVWDIRREQTEWIEIRVTADSSQCTSLHARLRSVFRSRVFAMRNALSTLRSYFKWSPMMGFQPIYDTFTLLDYSLTYLDGLESDKTSRHIVIILDPQHTRYNTMLEFDAHALKEDNLLNPMDIHSEGEIEKLKTCSHSLCLLKVNDSYKNKWPQFKTDTLKNIDESFFLGFFQEMYILFDNIRCCIMYGDNLLYEPINLDKFGLSFKSFVEECRYVIENNQQWTPSWDSRGVKTLIQCIPEKIASTSTNVDDAIYTISLARTNSIEFDLSQRVNLEYIPNFVIESIKKCNSGLNKFISEKGDFCNYIKIVYPPVEKMKCLSINYSYMYKENKKRRDDVTEYVKKKTHYMTRF